MVSGDRSSPRGCVSWSSNGPLVLTVITASTIFPEKTLDRELRIWVFSPAVVDLHNGMCHLARFNRFCRFGVSDCRENQSSNGSVQVRSDFGLMLKTIVQSTLMTCKRHEEEMRFEAVEWGYTCRSQICYPSSYRQ